MFGRSSEVHFYSEKEIFTFKMCVHLATREMFKERVDTEHAYRRGKEPIISQIENFQRGENVISMCQTPSIIRSNTHTHTHSYTHACAHTHMRHANTHTSTNSKALQNQSKRKDLKKQ